MKLKLLLAHTTAQFYIATDYNKKAVLRYQTIDKNKGFYIGKELSILMFRRLDSPLKKL